MIKSASIIHSIGFESADFFLRLHDPIQSGQCGLEVAQPLPEGGAGGGQNSGVNGFRGGFRRSFRCQTGGVGSGNCTGSRRCGSLSTGTSMGAQVTMFSSNLDVISETSFCSADWAANCSARNAA